MEVQEERSNHHLQTLDRIHCHCDCALVDQDWPFELAGLDVITDDLPQRGQGSAENAVE
jgi:hypothetical protein